MHAVLRLNVQRLKDLRPTLSLVTDDSSGATYPEHAALIADMCGLLKAARRPLSDEWKRYDLDADGWRRLEQLTDRLVSHTSFEYLERRELQSKLRDAVRRYKDPLGGSRPASKAYAAEVLDALAREPKQRTLYLGVRHLKLTHGTVVGDVRFLQLSDDDALTRSFNRFGGSAPELVCEVEAIGGTDALVLERARKTAERALALVRQQMLFGFMAKIYLDQVMFGLDGKYTWREGPNLAVAGWWRDPAPFPMDLAGPTTADWRNELAELSADYLALAADVRERVDVCVDWLDVAARTDRWRIIIPAAFSAMEALLVPETTGLKSGLVTVRSVAVHVAVGKGFFDPGKVRAGYELRDHLVHGTPTHRVLEKEATEFAEFTRLWAFDVLCDYLKLASVITAEGVVDVVRHLENGPCEEVCSWLEGYGGAFIVAEYRDALRSRNQQRADKGGGMSLPSEWQLFPVAKLPTEHPPRICSQRPVAGRAAMRSRRSKRSTPLVASGGPTGPRRVDTDRIRALACRRRQACPSITGLFYLTIEDLRL